MKFFIDNILINAILSIDVILLSINFGLQKIKIPKITIFFISIIEIIFISFGCLLSYLISDFISIKIISLISFSFLFVLSLYNYLFIKNENKTYAEIITLKQIFFIVFTILPDAFCASFSYNSFSLNTLLFILIHFIFTFFSLLLGFHIGFKINKKNRFNLDRLSPFFLICYSLYKIISIII